MAYCTADEVKAEFPTLIYASDTANGITQAEVTQWISDFSLYIDSQIANIYSTPVTAGAGALAVLKIICVDLTVGKLKSKLYLAGGAKQESQMVDAKAATDRAEKRLMAIRQGQGTLAGATAANSPTGNSWGAKNGQEPVFDRDVDQW